MVSINDYLSGQVYRGQNLGDTGTVSFNNNWRMNSAPFQLAQFAKWAGGPNGPLAAATRGAFQQQLEGFTSAELDARRSTAAQAQTLGISPTQYAGAEAERQRSYLGQIAGARAGSEAAFNEGLLGLGQSTLNATLQSIDYQKSLAFQEHALQEQIAAMKRGQNMGLLGSVIGAVGTVATGGMMPGGFLTKAFFKPSGGGGVDYSSGIQPGYAEMTGYGGSNYVPPNQAQPWGNSSYFPPATQGWWNQPATQGMTFDFKKNYPTWP